MVETIRSGTARSMQRVNQPISACRYCRFYQIEGRRGGSCQRLGVPVQGSWQVCALAVSPFALPDALPDAHQSDPARRETWSEMSALIATAVSPAVSCDPQPLFT